MALDASRQIVYVGTLGGVWHSYDWGATWAPSEDNTLPGAIGAVAVDNNGWVFAASGSVEGGEPGSGVYVSQDSGKHWRRMRNVDHATGKPILDGEAATSIFMDRTNPQGSLNHDHLFLTTTRGIYESGDGGDTWTRQTLPDPVTTAWQIIQDPVNAKRWEAVVSTGKCTGDIVEQATDSPGWVADFRLTSSDPGVARRVPLRMSIAGNVSRIVVLASGCDGAPYSDAHGNGPVFYHDSPDGKAITGHWDNFGAIFTTGSTSSDPFATGNPAAPAENGNVTNSIMLDPRSDHRCNFLVGGVWPLYWQDAGVFGCGDHPSLKWNRAGHADIHALNAAGGSSPTIFIGSDGGLIKSTDTSSDFQNPTSANGPAGIPYQALGTGLTYGADASNGTVAIGNQDTGLFVWNGAPAVGADVNNDAGLTATNQPSAGFVSTQHYGTEESIFKMASLGQAPAQGGPCPISVSSSGPACGDPTLFHAPFVWDSHNAGHAFTASSRLWESSTPKVPSSWTPSARRLGTIFAPVSDCWIPSDPSRGGRSVMAPFDDCFTAIALDDASATSNRAVILGSDLGYVWVRDPNGVIKDVTGNWSASTKRDNLPVVSSVAIRGSGSMYEAWVAIDDSRTTGNHLFYSSNVLSSAGPNWQPLDATSRLPGASVTAVLPDPAVPGTVYLAGAEGVYVCRECAGNKLAPQFLALGDGLPRVWVDSLALSRSDHTLYASTFGRGEWSLPLLP